MNAEIEAALRRLEVDVRNAEAAVNVARRRLADAEAKLDDLTVKRRGAEAFLTYMGNDTSVVRTSSAQKGSNEGVAETGRTSVMEAVMRNNANRIVTNAEAQRLAAELGAALNGEQVRNALSYLFRKGVIDKGGQRGRWILRDAEAPAATGASESEGPSDGSSWKEGGTGYEPAPPVVRGDDPLDVDVDQRSR